MMKEAAVILFKCDKVHKTFGVTVEKQPDGDWHRVWAFGIDEKRAAREGYDRMKAGGSLTCKPGYPGCPYCGELNFVRCSCGKYSCYHQSKDFICVWCGSKGEVESANYFDFDGGED